ELRSAQGMKLARVVRGPVRPISKYRERSTHPMVLARPRERLTRAAPTYHRVLHEGEGQVEPIALRPGHHEGGCHGRNVRSCLRTRCAQGVDCRVRRRAW